MRLRTLTLIAAATTLLACVGVAGAVALAGSSHHMQRGSVILTGSPGIPVVNARTHTLYVPIQCDHANSCPGKPTGRTLDIIDTSRCNSQVASRCRVVGTARGGNGPLAAAIDQRTDTIYVIDGLGAVSVLDGARCNASVRSHCGVLATIKTGGFDVAAALNPRTHTLYVAAPSGEVFVVNLARCNAATTRGCHQHVRKVRDPRGPDGIDVNLATNTVYAADSGSDGNGHTVSVINGARCNGATGKGCGRTPRTIAVGNNPYWVTVDQAGDTIYTANNNDGTVSVINGATCNATVSSGCKQHPRAVPTGLATAQVALDGSRHTVFALNQNDGTISEFNSRTCNGRRTTGCPIIRARNEQATFTPRTGYNPGSFVVDPSTGTAYLVNSGGEAYLAAISINRCNALRTTACRKEAPSVARPVVFPVVDPVTNTIYAGNVEKPGIEVLNGATCNAKTRSGCKPRATIPFPGRQANIGSIDRATDTMYASDPFSNTVWAIDVRHCNAHDISGCGAKEHKLTVGPGPGFPELVKATHTLYVTEGRQTAHGLAADRVAVLDASTCNAKVTSGCGQTPATIPVGPFTFELAVSQSTNTIYAPSGGPSFSGRLVWVINGAICNAGDHSGCGHPAARAKVGLGPASASINEATHTLYVSNNADGDLPGTVSVINTATCNGSHTSGCAGPFPTATVGRSPVGIAVDTRTNRVLVGNFATADVSIINGSHCNASSTSGCAKPVPERPTGSNSTFIAVNDRTGSVYVPSFLVNPRLSIFAESP